MNTDQREFTFAMHHGASIHHSSTDTANKGIILQPLMSPEEAIAINDGGFLAVDADIATLMEACWHHTASERPTMASTIDFLQMKIDQPLS